MESLSRPLHRRKLSNANGFSGKHAYDGVFSGHRPAGAPAVNVDEYREIFSTSGSSIPVLDLSNLDESSDELKLKPDYCNIFGGFREHDIAISYEELVARDKARAPSSTSQSSEDPGDTSHQSSDALKQFNMSYHKISQRNKNGLDGTTHVTQLHAVPGFTCFIDESASQPNNETVKQKSSSTNNVNVNASKQDLPEKQTTINNVNANSSKRDLSEKQTSQRRVEFSIHQEESLSDARNIKSFEADFESHPAKVSSSPESKKETKKQKPSATNNVPSSPPAASQPKTETEKQKSPATNNIPLSTPAASQPKKETESYPSKVSSPPESKKQNPHATVDVPSSTPAASQPKKETESYPSKVSSSSSRATNLDDHKDYRKRSTATNEEFPRTCFDEELHVNPAAAALRKAIEKAQESIRIAKESVGKKKDGLRGFSSKSFKESLKAKVRVANVNADVEHKEKDHKNGSTVVFSDFDDGEKPFGAKKGINELHEKISERSPFVFNNNKTVCSLKQVVGETETESVENNAYPHKDDERPDGFLVLESCEKKHGDTVSDNLTVCQKVETETEISQTSDQNGYEKKFSEESFESCETKQGDSLSNNLTVCQKVEAKKDLSQTSDQNGYEKKFSEESFESCETKQGDSISNNLTVCQKVEAKKEISQTSDRNGYEKKFSEESFGLLENNTHENLEQEHEEKVASAETQDEAESHSEEEKFYDVCEAETIKKAETYAYSGETNDPSQKADYENHEAEETYENSSSDYDDAEENDNVIDASNIVVDTEEARKVDQNYDNVESGHDNDDVSSSQRFQVEYEKTVEKEKFENISSDETEDNKDECEAKSDNLENCGVADVDFGQDDVRFTSSSDTIHGMEIEVKEYKEREESFEKEEENNNVQQSHEQTPEIRIETDTGTPQEPKDACRQSEPSKAAHDKEERERERIKLAVERAIREARERAFAEVRQRVIADTQEKVTKASIDKTSAQSKLKAERALVERATAEARQRALEKVMKTSQPRTQVNETKQTYSASQTNTESALRSKAKLEKHNRIMERAAKALAEKEKRDLLALREQAERNRLAEHLDADIKRWSTGKEGNLRALLSTLQYILGADSGWQPVSLTEIITTTAVKKAYRKATLCVHPDKLQQRGASIQQKYICEKVFDLLKAAWNRFNSEER
ncbi:putative DnaJ domain, Chaperone J-domain superfamily [Helianthus annuus]|nr:putative DnaJ domain, Chaperone J-domain superfamily [Helianthus annuus]